MALPANVERHERNLEKCLPKFELVLQGTGLSPARLKQTIVSALMANPYLAKSDPTSIMQAAMSAAVLGLECDGATGQGYIVPYGNKAQFITGYKGYITLAKNNGYIVSGCAVRENDKFDYGQGLTPYLNHKPAQGSSTDRGPIIYVYATARHATLPALFDVVHVEQVNEIRDGSQGYKAFMAGKIKSNPWATNYEKMAIKTAIRSLAPQLPLNVQKAHALESAFEGGKLSHITEQGDIVIEGEGHDLDQGGTKDRPDLTEELNRDGDICGKCGGSGEMPDLVGGTQPCIDCGGANA